MIRQRFEVVLGVVECDFFVDVSKVSFIIFFSVVTLRWICSQPSASSTVGPF